MEKRSNSPLILSRNYYTEYLQDRYLPKSSYKSKGWNCPTSKPYEPVGEMCNVYKGCKFLKKKLRKYDIDLSIPIPKQKCEFLKGKDASFVLEARGVVPKKRTNNRNLQIKAYTTAENVASEVTGWLKTRKKGRTRNDGMELLREELENSIIRLRDAQKGKLLIKEHSPDFYIRKECGTTCKKPFQSGKRLSAAFLQRTAYMRGNEISRNSFQRCMRTSQETRNLSLISSKQKQPYLKLLSLATLSAKVKEDLANGKASVTRLEKSNAQVFLGLLEKECSKFGQKRLVLPKEYHKVAQSVNLPRRVAEACEEFAKAKERGEDKLINALNTQMNSRPKTVSYKKRNLCFSTSIMKRTSELVKCRIKAEKDKVQEYKKLAEKCGTAYYSLAKYVFVNGYENHEKVIRLMEYVKDVIENGEHFTQEHLVKWIDESKYGDSTLKKYIFCM